MPVFNPDGLIHDRVTAIRRLHAEVGNLHAEIDVSGGIDSGVLVGLLARAVGPDHVIAVHSAIQTDPKATARAREVCAAYDVRLVELDLSTLYTEIVHQIRRQAAVAGWNETAIVDRCVQDRTILGSIRSTLRAPVGRACNRMFGGGVRHGTGNECEDGFARFYQKGGDGEVDCNAIAMLSKGEVYQLALALDVPRSLLDARPSPDLWGIGEEHNDEAELAAYFHFLPRGHHFYSYVDPETGKYRNVGLIERTSRFLDRKAMQFGPTYGERLFSDKPHGLADLLDDATSSEQFAGVEAQDVHAMLLGARQVERVTRHKHNPNCPTLGRRRDLVVAGLLTDVLPVC